MHNADITKNRFAKLRVPGVLALRPMLIGVLYLIAAAGFCLALVWAPLPDPQNSDRSRPQFHNLFHDSHEKLHNVVRLSEFHAALAGGQLVPRWCPNLNGGFGYPFFNFYAPLAYALAEIWHVLGFDLFLAWKIHFLLMTWLSAIFAYLYARLFFGRTAAFAAGLFYMLAPYHAVNLYIRGNVAEFTAMTIFPLTLYLFHRLAREPRSWKLGPAAAFSFAALILTHNITAMFGAIFLCVYLLALWGAMRRRFPFIPIAAAGICGGMISAFFWLPAVAEIEYCQTVGLDETFARIAEHAVHWPQFFFNAWGYGLSAPGTADDLSFTLGWAHVAGIVLAAVMMAVNRLKPPVDRAGAAWLLGLAALLLLMSPQGLPFWTIPGLSAIQFPWRLLTFASLAASVVAGCGVDALMRRHPRLGWTAMLVLCTLLVAVIAPKAHPRGYFPHDPKIYRPENTRAVYITTNIGEFNPKWVKKAPEPYAREGLSRGRILNEQGETVAVIPPRSATRARFPYRAPSPQTLRYEVYYFPGWQAYADGEPLPTMPEPEHGLIQFEAPAGLYEIRIEFGVSPPRAAGTALAWLGALAALIVWPLLAKKRNGRRPEGDAHSQ